MQTLDRINSTTEQSNKSEMLLQKDHIQRQQTDLSTREKELKETKDSSLKRFQHDKVVEINHLIEEQKRMIDSLEETVQQLIFASEEGEIVAPISGVVNVLRDLNKGDIVQSGESIVSVIPTNESYYTMSLAVPNHEIGKITEGNEVNFHFAAFPKQNFGHLTGEIKSISTDSVIQQDGFSYYTVEASIDNQPLMNRTGEQGEIRVGMAAEAFVVTDTKKIIHYLLEKINLRD